MFFCITFSKNGCFSLKKRESSIQQSRLESKETLFTPGDITKNSKILQKVKLIDMTEYSSFPVGYEYFTRRSGRQKKRCHELIINLPLLVLDLVNTFKKGDYDQNEIPFIL